MQLLRMDDLTEQGYGSRSSIYERMNRGEFPKPRKMGRINVWTSQEMEEYVAKLGRADQAA